MSSLLDHIEYLDQELKYDDDFQARLRRSDVMKLVKALRMAMSTLPGLDVTEIEKILEAE